MHSIILKLLKQARLANKYNQSDVGKAIGVKGNTVGNYENGVTEPDIDTFVKLCKFYGISYVDILEAAYGSDKELHFTTAEIALIKKYRALDERGKKAVDDTANSQLESMEPSAAGEESDAKAV